MGHNSEPSDEAAKALQLAGAAEALLMAFCPLSFDDCCSWRPAHLFSKTTLGLNSALSQGGGGAGPGVNPASKKAAAA